MPPDMKRFGAEDLRCFCTALLTKLGMEADMARAMAARVIDAELLGHRTHGLLFFPNYLDRIEKGHIARTGSIEVIADHGANFTWNGGRIAGAWLMERATAELIERAGRNGVVSAALANCSHIGCLQTYLLPFTEKGLMVLLAATNPGIRSVAPFGGIDPVLTTNPIAFGIPTGGTPILVDQSTTVASNALFAGYAARGERLPGPWLLDAEGRATDDPNVLTAKPAGTILPLGGLEFGYKGFGFGLLVEALALALAGQGRARKPDAFSQGVFLQVFDPQAFGGREDFLKEVDHLAAACRASRPRPGGERVRVPGERALASLREQLRDGVRVSPAALEKLAPWTQKLGVSPPNPVS
jgi:LDH2 family malate/lactate/ureidoglycolate dehydrogenase